MNNNNPIDTLGFSPAEIEAMREGVPMNGSTKRSLHGAAPDIRVRTPITNPTISRPDGSLIERPDEKVNRPSAGFAKTLGDKATADREAANKAEEALRKKKEDESFPALIKRVSFLERKLDRLQKQLKEVSTNDVS